MSTFSFPFGAGLSRRVLHKAKQLLVLARGGQQPSTSPEPSPDESYRADWNEAARADAVTAILSPPDGSANVESVFDEAGRLDADWIRRFLPPQATVLDVGCGIGRIEKYLAPYCHRMCSVDVSDEMIARARQRLAGQPNVELYRTSATDLSVFPAATFDFVFSYFVLQHMDHEDAFLALREIARVLKPGGHALLQFPNFTSPIYAATFVRQATARDRRPARVRLYTADYATRVLSLAGIEVERIETNPSGTMNENEIVVIARRQAGTDG
ncbi:MAG: class I SAM-dependent methyltransferase [Chloroflexi bacterium]|nr:class I SAM-dependent methyltransferase [Chloroflexota bacterium]